MSVCTDFDKICFLYESFEKILTNQDKKRSCWSTTKKGFELIVLEGKEQNFLVVFYRFIYTHIFWSFQDAILRHMSEQRITRKDRSLARHLACINMYTSL